MRSRLFALRLAFGLPDQEQQDAAFERLGSQGEAAVDVLIPGEGRMNPANRVVVGRPSALARMRDVLPPNSANSVFLAERGAELARQEQTFVKSLGLEWSEEA